jgi:MFS superfamily sulfate permease-like transporter
MLTSNEIAAVAGPGHSPESVAATLALLVGGALILARVLRLGFLANFISKPVLVGFEAGVGVAVFVGQLKSVLGVHFAAKSTLGILMELPSRLPQVHLMTALVALAGIAMLVVLPRLSKKIPASLVWVAASIAASGAIGLAALGVKSVGTVPQGLPTLALPDLSVAAQLWPAALGIALMSFTETMAAARTFVARGDPPIEPNRELFAIGAANLASALVGGLPSGGGTSQTAITENAGARSQMAQWVNAAAVLVCLLFLSPLIGLMPQAALGAMVLVAAASMIKPAKFRAIAQVRRDELAWSFATLVGVVAIGTLNGILVAVLISFLTLFYQSNHPPVYAMAYNRQKDVFRRLGEHASDEVFDGLMILRTEARLTFINASYIADKMHALVGEPPPRVLVLECSAIPDIEYTALENLIAVEEKLRERGVTLWLTSVNPGLYKMIERSPLAKVLGHERMFLNLNKALEEWRRMGGDASAPDGAQTSTVEDLLSTL